MSDRPAQFQGKYLGTGGLVLLPSLAANPSAPADGASVYVSGGRVYVRTPGAVVPLEFGAETSSIIANSGFETVSGGEPTAWSDFWQNGGSSVVEDTTNYVAGTKSAKYLLATGAGSQVAYMCDAFAVTPGGTLTVDVYAMGDASDTTSLGFELVTAPSGTPDFFQADTNYQVAASVALPAAQSFARYSRSFAIPAGATVARLVLRGAKSDSPTRNLWVDSLASRIDAPAGSLSWVKQACVAAATGDVSLAPGSSPSTADGVSLAVNSRVLVPAQTAPAQCGIYVVTVLGTGSNGTWVRASDATSATDLAAAMVAVTSGTVNGGTRWGTSFKATDTVDTTAQTWALA